MIVGLDHVVVLLNELDAATETYQRLLGRAPAWSSQGEGSRSVLFTLDNMSLELMAPDGTGGAAERIRNVIKIWGEGLASLAFRTSNIERMHRRLERVALRPEPVTTVESRDSLSGAVMSWKRTRATTDLTRGVRMFFLELAQDRPLSRAIADAPVLGLDHVVVSTEDPDRAAALYGARLGLDMALDRSHHDWGRLMFFRCGDLIVETVCRPVAGGDRDRDKLWGLSWRVEDLDAVRARLAASGVGVSEVRAGRQPGTRVASLRDGTCGVHTLLIERAPRRG